MYFRIKYEVKFASFLYETFMKQNCWQNVEEHTHMVDIIM